MITASIFGEVDLQRCILQLLLRRSKFSYMIKQGDAKIHLSN